MPRSCLLAIGVAAMCLRDAPAQSAYTLSDLGSLAGYGQSVATAINASGQVAGWVYDSGFNTTHAVLFADGRVTDVGTLPGNAFSVATAINATGWVAGGSAHLNYEGRGFVYRNGSLTDLGTLSGNYCLAFGINGSGQIVGETTSSRGIRAFLYTDGRMTDLGTLGGDNSSARAINDAGQIVGKADMGALSFGIPHAFSYANGRMTDLGSFGGAACISWANAINASGQIVGASGTNPFQPQGDFGQAFLYAGGRMTALGTLPRFSGSEASGINSGGQIVGSAYNRSYGASFDNKTEQHAFAYLNNRMFDLNDLVLDAGGWTLLHATAINDNGQIAGYGVNPTGDVHAFLLTPQPGPIPLITRPPASQHVTSGSRVSFTVATNDRFGGGLTYQWKKDGVALPGATASSLTIASVAPADMGFYSVVVSDNGGPAESKVAILTVYGAPQLNYVFSTFAGQPGTSAIVDATGTAARFDAPGALAIDRKGNIYVYEGGNSSIRKISPAGAVTTIASRLYATALACDGDGAIYYVDGVAHTVGKVSVTGAVTIIAGAPNQRGADNGPAADARFNGPAGIAIDTNGNIFVADRGNATIRKISPDGLVTTLAGLAGSTGITNGTGTAARFASPMGMAVDASGNVYVADLGAYCIRKVTPAGVVSTLAGNPSSAGSNDGTGSAATFNFPDALAVDNSSGTVFVCELNSPTIRQVTPAGVVTTIGGSPNNRGNVDGIGPVATFDQPIGIVVDADGNLFIADIRNHVIRKGAPPGPAPPSVSRLINISTRGVVRPSGALTPGFVLRGVGSKQLVVRGIGPALAGFGVATALANPKLELIRTGSTAAMAANDDWGINPNRSALLEMTAAVGGFPLANDSKDAALLATLDTSANGAGYSVRIVADTPAASGLVLAEVYDADPLTAPVQLVNVSTLGWVGSGADALVAGFVIGGNAPKQLLVRAVGPGLAGFNVADALADPQLAVIPVGKTLVVANNDNWAGLPTTAAAFAQVGAFPLAESGKDASLVVRLPPGGYTVVVSGTGNTSGYALVEIYDLEP